MNLALTDTQAAFAKAVRDYAERRCGTREQRDALTNGGEELHNPDVYRELAVLGWLGVGIPEEYGGSGGGLVDRCVLFEEINHGLVPASGYATSAIVIGCYERAGSAAQKKEILGGIAAGRVESIAMTEPDAGSDLSGLRTRAERVDDHYIINGQKTFITNAHFADNILVITRTDPNAGPRGGLSMISVPTDAEGIVINPIQTMGDRVNEVYFTDVRVPSENVVGVPHEAWHQLMGGLNGERLYIAASMLGLAQRAFDDTLAYIKERKQFGRPIGSFQVIRHRMADLACEIECCRLLTYNTAAMIDAGPSDLLAAARLASFAKLKVTEVAKSVSLAGMQSMGGYGYSMEFDMQSHVRAALLSTIIGGTSEIQREIISKTLGL